jgi:transposase-like protein
MTLALVGNTLLRTAIMRNLVSFPAQVRPFMRRGAGDVQERIVQLYFVRGWTVRSICQRYDLSKAMAHKLLAEWRIRAVESGHIQEIEPGTLDGLLRETSVQETSAVSIPAPVVKAPEAPPVPGDFFFAPAVSAPPADLSSGSGV